jgi:CxxC motif-containing protein (DUF1111 family)
VSQFAGKEIYPFTDLLLHDMGPGLADRDTAGNIHATEWKTPPLWGIGLFNEVNGHTRYLHDGRAQSIHEAILWHAGEAESAKQDYLKLSAAQRAQLLRFIDGI